jgi:exodeoxyribonuclease VIII
MTNVTIIPPGTETAEAYRASGAWGSSLISKFLASPRLVNAIRTGAYKEPETAAMRTGQHFHQLLDPNSGFGKTHRCGPDADRRTTIWKTAETTAKTEGITLLPKDDWDALHRMADSVRANPLAEFLLRGAEFETGFRVASGPIQVQCRTDILHRWNHLADLKTTTDLDDFGKSVVTYGYHRQAALYRKIVHQACGKWLPFSFIIVEKSQPFFRSRVVDLTQDFLDIGAEEVESALLEIADRTSRNDWSDHRDADSIAPPGWLLDRVRQRAA